MKKAFVVVLTVAAGIAGAFAATTFTWTGGGTPNEDGSLNWTDSANWNATAPAYPGRTSTDDKVVFPAGTAARVRLDVTKTIYLMTAKADNLDLTFDSPDGHVLTLRSSFELGDNASTGQSHSTITLDGAKIVAAQNTYLRSGSSLVLKNAADLKVTTVTAWSSAYEEGLIDLSGRSVLTMTQLDIGGGGKLVIDDSTVTNTSHVYVNEGGTGGGRIVFKGAHPLWVIKGQNCRSANTATYVDGTDFDFLVPEGGYAEPPLQYMHATGKFLNGATNVKVPMRLNLLAESPAIAAGDPLDLALVTTVAGIYTAGLALNGAQHAGSITVDFNDAATAVVSHISLPEKTLDVESVNAFASGANIANVHREDLSEGDEIVLRAEPVVTPRGTATPTGIRVFDVDPDTLARTEIDGSPFAGSEVTYVHGTTRRAIVWQWSWAGEGDIFVSPSVGSDANGGTSWSDAYATVGKAFEGLTGGKVVVLDVGEHPIAGELILDVGATVKGMGMFESALVPADPSACKKRCMTMNHASALIEDLAISGFNPSAGNGYKGRGLYVDTAGGTARRCRFNNNAGNASEGHGVGAYLSAGSLFGCLIDHNKGDTNARGGGLYLTGSNVLVENCLIVGNTSGKGGAGVCVGGGKLANCTIAGNSSEKEDGGGGVFVSSGKLYNCIIWGNSAPNDPNPHAPDIKIQSDGNPSSYLYNCISRSGAGTEGLAVDPEFTDAAAGDYTLRPNSPAIDAGSDERYACSATVDFAGNPRRVGTIDIGCYEVDTTVLACGLTASQTEIFVGESVTLTATVRGGRGNLDYAWAALDQDGVTLSDGGEEVTATFSKAGRYGFRLTVADSEAAEPVSAVREGYVYVVPRTVQVALGDDLQTVVNAAIDGQELVLAEGRHVVPSEVTIDRGVRIVGPGYDRCAIAYEGSTTRVLYVNHPDAVVSGVTITGGKVKTRSVYGCGVWIGVAGGTVTNCFITGNNSNEYYLFGGGVGLTGDKALLTHCIVCSNKVSTSTSYGGGICMSAGTVDTCLVFDNSSSYGGGGLAFHNQITFGKVLDVRNSTFARNTATSYGGGVYYGAATVAKVKNCLFAGNVADNDPTLGAPEWSPNSRVTAADYANVTNQTSSCAFYAANPVGEGSVAVAQPFEDPSSCDFHLLAGNGAVDAGAWYEGIADDLDGKARDETPDIGCYELDKSQFTCSFAVEPTVAFNDEPVAFTPTVMNPPGELAYTWTLTDRFGETTVLGEVAPTQAIAKCEWYAVKLRVELVGNPSKAAEYEYPERLHVAPHDLYAVGGGVNPTMAYPFDSEKKAHTNLLELAEEMVDGTRVHLGEGEFVVTNEFAVIVGATVTGEGRDKTVVRYVQPAGATGCRVIRLNHSSAVVERLTATGGHMTSKVNENYTQWGYGALIDAKGGTLQDCRVTGNNSGTFHLMGAVGVKSTSGFVHRCIIDNNRATTGGSYGGGLTVSAGFVDNCLVVSNTANYGGGVYISGSSAEVRNCTVVDNFSNDTGYGADSTCPGGLYMNNCGDDVKVANCIFLGNQPGVKATKATCSGYPEFHMLWNTSSHALDSTRAKASLLNCLLDVDLEDLGATSVGTDGLTGDPRFYDRAGWDFRLRRGSPCVNAGDNRDYTADDLDLLGAKRILNFGKKSGIVDIGCSESPWGTRGLIIQVW